MPKYEAEFEIPLSLADEELGSLIESLREFGHPKLIVRVEAKSRKEAASELGESCSSWWPLFYPEWWHEVLRVIRGKRAQQDI